MCVCGGGGCVGASAVDRPKEQPSQTVHRHQFFMAEKKRKTSGDLKTKGCERATD